VSEERSKGLRPTLCLMALLSFSAGAGAGTGEEEIQYLLESVGQSGCEFMRNEKSHDATDAEAHLRMKYRNGKFWINDAEQFIERIASKSSWSGQPYFISCPNTDPKLSAAWLLERLDAYRKTS
jgi:hypothetical protein